jgi:hypothetical protein
MTRSAPTLLTRLRRHRGLWVLVAAVLMIKLVAGTLCLSDGPGARFASSATAVVALPDTPMDTAVADVGDGADTCWLGEGRLCHCACAHTVTLPTTVHVAVPMMDARFDSPAILSGYRPPATGSLLRPPIA